MPHFNGGVRKAAIGGVTTLLLGVIGYAGNSIVVRLERAEARIEASERENFRIGKIAAGRGERIDRLDTAVTSLTAKVQALEIRMSVSERPRFRSTRETE